MLAAGCSTGAGSYRLAPPHRIESQQSLPDTEAQLERGTPHVWLDAPNHYVLSLPTKLILWNWHVLDHRLPAESVELLSSYLTHNEMRSVKVRFNQYTPGGELRRLVRNREVAAGYRYSLGLFAWLRYTLLPDRLLAGAPFIGGGDHFNPFTNTVNVYSSDPAVLLHEAGHAKDYLRKRFKGTEMGLLRIVPGIDLWHEAYASADAIAFLKCAQVRPAELGAYPTLFPAYATYVSGYLPSVVAPPVVVAGHVTGRLQSARRRRALERAEAGLLPEPKAQAVLGTGACVL